MVTAVLGLDDRPQARAHFRTAAAASSATSYTPLQLGTIYRFPGGTDGSGQTLTGLRPSPTSHAVVTSGVGAPVGQDDP